MISVSIIIVTYNSGKEISNCINSLLPQLSEIDGEILIIDNNSDDNTISIVNNFDNIAVIQNKQNTGYTQANNQGIKKSKGEYIFLLNPDTIVPDSTIKQLIDELKINHTIGAIAPQLHYPNGDIQYSCRRFPRRRDIIYESIGLGKIFSNLKEFNYWKMGDFDHNTTQLVDQPAGAALLIRKTVIDKIGLLDEQFPMFFSDVDLCKRILEAGYKIQYDTKSFITHLGGVSIFQNRLKMIISSHLSFWKYFNKYSTGICDYFLNMITGIFLLALIPFRIIINIIFPNFIKSERRSL